MIEMKEFVNSLFQTEVKITAEMLYYMTLSSDDVEKLMIYPRVKEELITYIIDNLNLIATKSESNYNTIVYNMKLYAFDENAFKIIIDRMNLLINDNDTFMRDLNLLNQKYIDLENERDDFGSDCQVLSDEAEGLKDEIYDLENEVSNLEGEVDDLNDEINNLKNEITTLDEEINTVIHESEIQINSLQDEANELQDQIIILQDKLIEAYED